MAEKLLAEWFWVDRWMGSRAFALPIDARGLYREMLSQAWRRQARLPNDPEQVRRLTGVTLKEWRRCWPLVAGFWRIDGETLVNDTQLEVYADAKGRLDRARARAQAAAQARYKQVLKQCPPSPSPSQSKEEKKRPAPRAGAIRGSVCPHGERCETTKACIERTLRESKAS